ncbi:hypothetical protein BX616_009634 [Lobosporangium transversale]|nr:hypothetical protein BX616_009634 [Lobosporangium transversale]
MSMQYDSDSDSAEDLDFEPTSEPSSDDNNGSETDEAMEESGDDDGQKQGSSTSKLTSTEACSRPSKKGRKKSAATEGGRGREVKGKGPLTQTKEPSQSIATTATEDVTEMSTAQLAAATGATPAIVASEEVVKKKKGPKKGTKYKKRTPATGKEAGTKSATKTPKVPKVTKKAAAVAAAQVPRPIVGRFGFQNNPIDLDHPLETFKWPYSPFTAEFKTQHQARDKMASDIHRALQELTDANGRATWRLQELDHQLQMSRQDLKTSLDEIQFRKSQLRDMSILAVDIVKKLSLPRPEPQELLRRQSLPSLPSSGAGSGNESGPGGYASSYKTIASHLDGDHMDLDGDNEFESGGEQQHSHENTNQQGQHAIQRQQLHNLKGVNEGNVRSFLEKIRALEQAQRQVVV